MAIACDACSNPVHPQVVICPHCGEPTGVAANATLTAEETAAAVEFARIEADTYVAPPELTGLDNDGVDSDPEFALIGGAAVAALAVGVAVKSAVETAVNEHRQRHRRPELPRAIARERPAPPVVPTPSREPEPAQPRSAQPRFLKRAIVVDKM